MALDVSEKASLRQEIYQQLAALSADEIANESGRIVACLKLYLQDWALSRNKSAVQLGIASKPLRVAVYHAMDNEADLHDLYTDRELSTFVDFYLPRSVRDEGDLKLKFAMWPKNEKNRQPKDWVVAWYGAIEPPADLAEEGIEFDLLLIPCVAVSPYGERLGHGKGYYDRFLKTQTDQTPKYAVCLTAQAVSYHLPMETHDVHLDGRVTAGWGLEEAV